MRELERNSKNWGVLVSDRKNRESARRKRKKEKGKRENQLKKKREAAGRQLLQLQAEKRSKKLKD